MKVDKSSEPDAKVALQKLKQKEQVVISITEIMSLYILDYWLYCWTAVLVQMSRKP